MSKFVIGENKEFFNVEDALTITKAIWSDENPSNQNRLYRFVTASGNGYKVSIASKDSYICGVTISNDSFLGVDKSNPKYCVVQSMGVVKVEDDGTLSQGDRCMPDNNGKAILSTNSYGYEVVERVDSNHVNIIISPNNDMIQRLRETILFEGTGTENIQLSDNVANYKYIDIQYENYGRNHIRLYPDNDTLAGMAFQLSSIMSTSNTMQINIQLCSFSNDGLSITRGTQYYRNINANNISGGVQSPSNITIYKVVGYK